MRMWLVMNDSTSEKKLSVKTYLIIAFTGGSIMATASNSRIKNKIPKWPDAHL